MITDPQKAVNYLKENIYVNKRNSDDVKTEDGEQIIQEESIIDQTSFIKDFNSTINEMNSFSSLYEILLFPFLAPLFMNIYVYKIIITNINFRLSNIDIKLLKNKEFKKLLRKEKLGIKLVNIDNKIYAFNTKYPLNVISAFIKILITMSFLIYIYHFFGEVTKIGYIAAILIIFAMNLFLEPFMESTRLFYNDDLLIGLIEKEKEAEKNKENNN